MSLSLEEETKKHRVGSDKTAAGGIPNPVVDLSNISTNFEHWYATRCGLGIDKPFVKELFEASPLRYVCFISALISNYSYGLTCSR